jgi:glycosyltransferase involved in cell wall biosynthesis
LLQEAAVFCLPSHDEGLPMAMLEAMASAKAMVVTPVGGIPDAVKQGEHALLVPPGDVAALAVALQSLLADAGLRRRLGQAAREQVVQRYSAPRVMAQLDAIYARLGAPAPRAEAEA